MFSSKVINIIKTNLFSYTIVNVIITIPNHENKKTYLDIFGVPTPQGFLFVKYIYYQ